MKFLKKIRFYKDYIELKRQSKNSDDIFPFNRFYPCLDDKDADSGTASGHYFHQDLFVARRIFHNAPERHVDIGSRIDGFVAHVASYRQIEVFDVRPLKHAIKNIIVKQVDASNPSSFTYSNYCDSVSSLHAIEHFGLGRYGDPLDYHGHLKGLANIHNMLKPSGKFYFSVPIGKQRIEFNAHRVFSLNHLLGILSDKYYIDSFSYVDDDGFFHEAVELKNDDIENNYNCKYGCGIFELTKKQVMP